MLKFCRNGVQGHVFRRVLLYSTSPLSSTEGTTLSLEDYLMDSLGLSKQQAVSTSTKLSKLRHARGTKVSCGFNFIKNADLVVNFLKQNGFELSDIRNTVIFTPPILVSKVEKTLKPKFEAFQELGLSGPELATISLLDSNLLHRNLNSILLPAIQALRDAVGSNENVYKIIKVSNRYTLYSILKHLGPNISLLRSYGIPLELIQKQILLQPKPFLRTSKSFEDIVIRVEQELGIPRDSRMFLRGVHLLASLSKRNTESKCRMFESFGWSQSNIMALIRRNPYSFALSEARIKKSLNFLMKESGLEPTYLAAHPALLSYGLERRVVPRHRILMVLKEKGLVRKEYHFNYVACMTEPKFLERFVLPFKEVHEVYTKHTGHPVRLQTEGSASVHP